MKGKLHFPWVTFILVLGFTAGLACITPFAWSQEVTATITGKVEDPSGAPIAGAIITAKDLNRGTTLSAKTNEIGVFNIQRVPVGTYEVRTEAKGFQSALESPVTLDLNQVARLSFQLKVGSENQTIEVSDTTPALQTDTAVVGTVIDAKTNDNLPLATRNPVQLTLLAPGAVTVDAASFNYGSNTAEQNESSGGRPYINGNREQSDNFLLDGIDNNEASDNLVGFTPSPDAIQEFNLITQNASAEFGNFQGGIINASIKSGTNQYHGSVFEFLRNNVLNANKWEDKYNPANELPTPPLRWNMFGGAVGGPIIKDKLFFFADYQGGRFDNPSNSVTIGVLTAAERTGNFGGICQTGFTGAGVCKDLDANGNPTNQLYNPCAAGTGINGGTPCQLSATPTAFANNIIPSNMLNPAFTNMVTSSLYPNSVTTGANGFGVGINSVSTQRNSDQGDIKIDYNASDKDRIFGRYSEGKQFDPTINTQLLLGNSDAAANLYNTAFDWTHTISSNFVNDFRFGTNHIVAITNNFFESSVGQFATTTLGISGANPGSVVGLPEFGFAGGTPSEANGGGDITNLGNSLNLENFAATTIQVDDSLIYTHGRHSIKTGFQANRYRLDIGYTGNAGELGAFVFDGQYTTTSPLNTNPTSSYLNAGSAADFALGLPSTVGRGAIPQTWYQRDWLWAGYVQDDWRITDRLTLNLGLRYEARTPWNEVNNDQVNVNIYTGALEYPGNDTVVGVGSNGFSKGLYNTTYGLPDFQPRIGFAQQLGKKSVIRGAFTLSSYLEGTGTNLRLAENPPFTPTQTSSVNGTTTGTAPSTLQDGFGSAPALFQGVTLNAWAPTVQPAVAQQWNLTVQRELTDRLTLQAGYVGQHGTHEMVPLWLGQGDLTASGVITYPFLGGMNSDGTFGPNHLSGAKETASIGSTKYNALQVVLQQRAWHDLEAQVSYTWSKCMTDDIGYYGTYSPQTQAANASPYYQNLFDQPSNWGECYFDTRQVLSAYALYELPFGRGKQFANHLPTAANLVVGNWSLDPIVSWHTGFPIGLSSNDESGTNSFGPRPNCDDSLLTYPKTVSTSGLLWFNPAFESTPAPGTFGNCPTQGPVVGPGYVDVDLSLHKDFGFGEARKLQFRADILNAFNHANFSAPSGSTGFITGTQDAREVQLALKFYF